MTETEIDEGAWAERYVTGRLGESDLALFEAHLVDCPACLDRVDTAARLGAALRRSEHPPSRVASTPPRRPHWARRAASWSAAAAAGMALAVGAGVTAQNARRSEAELAARLADAQAQLAVARRDAERAREAPPSPPPVTNPPRPARVPVLVLLATRGAELPVLRLPEPGQPVVLSVEREDPPRFPLYRATLQTRSGTAVWQDTVAPGSREAVLLGLDSSLLPPGEYRLTLEGQARGNRWSPVGDHRFRTVPSAAVR